MSKRPERQAVKRSTFDQKAQLEQEVTELQRQKEAFEAVMRFAKQTQTPIWNVNDQSTKQTTTYTRYTKEQILQYMQAPSSNESNLRKASAYMWDASSQYRRLISYYSMLPRWDYILTPMNFDKASIKADAFKKQYLKVQQKVELMNLRHELEKSAKITFRDGIIYGAIWQNKTSFYVQRINPDYCTLTSIVDGTFVYSVDMSKIRENQLNLYPPEFTTMYNNYKSTGVKYQEVPLDICWCLKADETNPTYSIPPWASTLPLLYDIETYKSLQETATKIANYKLLGMKIPLNDEGVPKVDWDLAEKYYRQLCSALPPYVGAFLTPMDTESYEFEKSGNTNDVDTVSRAEEQYWFNTGTSALLHGSNTSNTAGALKLSIKSDEQIVLSFMNQAERLLNRLLKNISGTIKFQLRFLPVTWYNQDEQVKLYKEASTLGIPGARSAYAAALDIHQADLAGLAYLENEMLDTESWTPLTSGYTGGVSPTSDEGGRPAKDDVDLDDAGEATRASDANANR